MAATAADSSKEVATQAEQSKSAHPATARTAAAPKGTSKQYAQRAHGSIRRQRPYNYKIVIAYDGTDFGGYQLQQGASHKQRTVQGVLQQALATRLQERAEDLHLLV